MITRHYETRCAVLQNNKIDVLGIKNGIIEMQTQWVKGLNRRSEITAKRIDKRGKIKGCLPKVHMGRS